MKKTIQILYRLCSGLIGGIIALFIAVILEIIISVLGKPPLSIGENPISLLTLIIPAFLEEISKTAIAYKIISRLNNVQKEKISYAIWIIIGTGIGFGLSETYLLQSSIPLRVSSLLLPVVHLVFVTLGYLIAKKINKEEKYFYFEWLLASTLLHWGYNVAQIIFLLKP